MQISIDKYPYWVVGFILSYLVVLYLFNLAGIDDNKFQLIPVFVIYAISFIRLRNGVGYNFLLLLSLFLVYGLFISFFSEFPLQSLFYVLSFLLIFSAMWLISDSPFNNRICILRAISCFIYFLPFFSFLNLFIGKSTYFPFSVNVSVFDLLWATLFPVCFFKMGLRDKFLLVFFSVLIGFFHDASAVYVLIVLVLILYHMRWFIESYLVWSAAHVFLILFVLYVVVTYVILIHFPLDSINPDGLIHALKSDDVDFYKRLGLIIQGFYYSQLYYWFGVGFGVDNYVLASGGVVNNTPQLLFLTIACYSGVTGLFIISCLFTAIFRRIVFYSSDAYVFSVSLLTFTLMISIHEYLFNPLAMLGPLLIASISSRECC